MAQSDLSITIDDGLTAAVPGNEYIGLYQVLVSNAGPAGGAGNAVTVTFDSDLTSVDWTCVSEPGSTCPAPSFGAGDITKNVSLSPGTAVTFTVTATISPSATGTLLSTAVVAPPVIVVDPVPGNNSNNDNNTVLTPVADLSISKTDGVTSAVPGEAITYTIIASNAGPSDAVGAVVTDTFGADFSGVSWTCVAAGGSSCGAGGSGPIAGNISRTITVAAGGNVTYTAIATIDSASTGTLSNTALIAVGAGTTDPGPGANSASDTNTALTPEADLELVSISDGVASAVTGETRLSYTILVDNDGPSDVPGALLDVSLAPGLVSAAWSCTTNSGGNCLRDAGSGAPKLGLDLEAGERATITVDTWLAPDAQGVGGTCGSSCIVSSATVSFPPGVGPQGSANESKTDSSTSLLARADLGTTKTNNLTGVGHDQSFTYEIVVSNSGPGDVRTASVSDVFSGKLVGHTDPALCNQPATDPCWQCTPAPVLVGVDMETGLTGASSVAVSLGGNLVAATAQAAGTVRLYTRITDHVSPSPFGTLTLADTVTSLNGASAVAFSSNGSYVYVASGGLNRVVAFRVDPGPVLFQVDAETGDVGLGGASSLALSPDGRHLYVTGPSHDAVAVFGRDPGTGQITYLENQGTLVGASSVVVSPDGAHVYISNAGAGSVVTFDRGNNPGSVATFGRLTNRRTTTGVAGASAVAVSPSGLEVYVTSSTASELVIFERQHLSGQPAFGDLTERDRIVADPRNEGLVGAASVAVSPDSQLVLVAGAGDNGVAVFGRTGPATLTFLGFVGDLDVGPPASGVDGLAAASSLVVDPTGAQVLVTGRDDNALVALAITEGSSCPTGGTGDIALSNVRVSAGGFVTLLAHAKVKPNSTGQICNEATATALGGVTDLSPGNDTSPADCDTISLATDLVMAKTDGTPAATPGMQNTYVLTVSNSGSLGVTDNLVTDVLPIFGSPATQTAGFVPGSITWTCVTAGAASCPSPSTGVGNINALVDLPAGDGVVFTVTGTIHPWATGILSNTATVTPRAGVNDSTPGNNFKTDVTTLVPSADLSVVKSHGPVTEEPTMFTFDYTIVAHNDGPSAAQSATIQDSFSSAGVSRASWPAPELEPNHPRASAQDLEGSSYWSMLLDPNIGSATTNTSDSMPHITVGGFGDGSFDFYEINITSASTQAFFDIDGGFGGDGSFDAYLRLYNAAGTMIASNDDTPSGSFASYGQGGSVSDLDSFLAHDFVSPGRYFIEVGAWPEGNPVPFGANYQLHITVEGHGFSPSPAGSGDLSDVVDLDLGATLTYRVAAELDKPAPAEVINLVTVTGGSDPDTGNNSWTDLLTLAGTADVAIFKTDGRTQAIPGGAISYVITVTNGGPDDVPRATVSDPFPAELFDVTWTCDPSPPIPGDLQPVRPGKALIGASAVVLSPDGEHVYAVGSNAPDKGRLNAYVRDTNPAGLFGQLGFLQTMTRDEGLGILLGGANDATFSSDGRHLYVTATDDNALMVFFRDWASSSPDFGKLSLLETFEDDKSGIDGLGAAQAVALSPDGATLYVAGASDNAVAVFERDDTTGRLTLLEIEVDGVDDVTDGGGTVDGIFGSAGVAVSPDGGQVYVTGANDNAVAVFTRDPATGLLSFLSVKLDGVDYGDPGGTVDGLGGARAVTVSPDGSQVYVGGATAGAVATFSRQLTTGALSFDLASSHAALAGVSDIAISNDGQHLVAAGTDADALAVYRRNVGTGLITYQESLTDALDGELDGVRSVAISGDGRHVYTAAANYALVTDGVVSLHDRTQPAPGFAFVEAEIDNEVGGGADGLLGARSAVVSGDGQNVYVTGFGDDAVAVFERDVAEFGTSHLQWVSMVREGDGGLDGLDGAVASDLSPDDRHLYVVSETDSAIAVFARNPVTGSLTHLQTIRDDDPGVDGLAGVLDVVVLGSHVYVAGQFDAAVAVFSRESNLGSPNFGKLTFVAAYSNGNAGVQGLSGVSSVDVSADGRHLYATSRVDDGLVLFSRDAESASASFGELTFVEVLSDGVFGIDGLDQAMSVAVSPDGGHVYTAGLNDDALAVFDRNDDETSDDFGRLIFLEVHRGGLGGLPGLAGARSVAVAPDNRHVYVVGEHDGALNIFARISDEDSTDFGRLNLLETRVDDTDGVLGLGQAYGVTVSPDSRNIYVASLGDHALAAFVRRSGSSCSASGEGNLIDEIQLGAGGSVQYTVLATIDPGATGTLTNTALVTLPASINDPDPSDNTATDNDTLLTPTADLGISKTDFRTSAVSGDRLTYSIDITNSGPSHAVGAVFGDDLNLHSSDFGGAVSWTCAAIGSGSLEAVQVLRSDDGVAGLGEASGVALVSFDPDGAGILPEVHNVYVTGLTENSLAVFTRSLGSGELTLLEVHTNGVVPVIGLSGASDVVVSDDGLNVYAVGRFSDAVVAFRRDLLDGSLTFLGALDDASHDGLDQAVALITVGDHVYVAGANDNAITVFERLPADGSLTFLEAKMDGQDYGNGAVDGLAGVTGLAVDPTGSHLYGAGEDDGAVAIFDRQGDGTLVYVSVVGQGSDLDLTGASALVVSAAGSELYVAGATDGNIFVLDRNTGDGSLSQPVQVIEDGLGGVFGLAGVRDLILSGDSSHLYAAGRSGDAIALFTRDAGDGTLVFVEAVRDGVNNDGLDGVSGIALSSDGRHLYAAARSDSSIATFRRPSDSSCAASGIGSPISAAVDIAAGGRLEIRVSAILDSDAFGIACDPNDPPGDPTVPRCVLNTATISAGASFVDNATTNNSATDSNVLSRSADLAITKDDGLAEFDGLNGAVSVVLAPPEGGSSYSPFVYVAGGEDSGIAVFSRSEIDQGSLTFVGFERDGMDGVDGLSGVAALTLSSDGLHLYAAGADDNAVVAFERDLVNGELSLLDNEFNGIGGVSGLLGARDLALSSNGSHLYVVGNLEDSLVVFDRDDDPTNPTFGMLTFNQALQQGFEGVTGLQGPVSVVVSPDGGHVLVASKTSASIAVFARDTDSESLTFGQLTFEQSLADGQWVDSNNNGQVEDEEVIDGLAGATDLVMDNDFIYVAGADDNALAIFAREAAQGSDDYGLLTFSYPVVTAIDGLQGPSGLGLSPAGNQLYVTAGGANGVVILNRELNSGSPDFGRLSHSMTVRNGETQQVGAPPVDVVVQGLVEPVAVAVADDGQNIYVAAFGADSLVAFVRDEGPGSPTFGEIGFLEVAADGGGGAQPGTQVLYTITVSNNGPSAVEDAHVTDIFPVEFENLFWTCSTDIPSGTVGATTCPAGDPFGEPGDLNHDVDIAVGARLIFSAWGDVRPRATGTLVNTATVSTPGGTIDPDSTNNSATDDNTVLAPMAALSILKDNGLAALAAGQVVTYTVVASNAGPSHAPDSTVSDLVPEAITDVQWACVGFPPPGLLALVETESDGVNDPDDTGGVVNGLAGASGVALSSDGRHVYVSGATAASVALFERDNKEGSLSFVMAVTNGDTQDLDGDGNDDVTVDGLLGAGAMLLSADDNFLYVAGAGDDAIAVFVREASSSSVEFGFLTFVELERDGINGVNGIGGVRFMAFSPSGGQLYAAGAGDGAVAVFNRNSLSGHLTFVEVHEQGSGDVDGVAGVSAVAVSADGRHLYAAGETSNAVAIFDRAGSGELAWQDQIADGVGAVPAGALAGPSGLLLSDDDRYLVVAAGGDDAISVFERDPADGSLTLVQTLQDAVDLNGVTHLSLSPDQKQLYAAAPGSSSVVVYARSTDGQLAHLETTSTGALAGVRSLAVAADGEQVYAAAPLADSVSAFQRLAGSSCSATGVTHVADVAELSPGGSVTYTVTGRVVASALGEITNTAMILPSSSVFDPDLADNTASDTDPVVVHADLGVVKDDGLTDAVAGTENTYQISVTNHGPSDVFGATVSDIFPIGPSPVAGFWAGSMSWSCWSVGNLELFEIRADGDTLDTTPVDGLDGASWLVVSPDLDGPGGEIGGHHLYASGAVDGGVAVFGRATTGTQTGSLTFSQSVIDGDWFDLDDDSVVDTGETVLLAGASGMDVSPDGEHLYVAAAVANTLSIFTRDSDQMSPTWGQLTLVTTLRHDTDVEGLEGATAVTVSADGNNVYTAAKDSDTIAVFTRDPVTGELGLLETKVEGVGDVPLLVLDGVRDLVISPDGAHVYAASQQSDSIAIFARDASGNLTFLDVLRNLEIQSQPGGGAVTVWGIDFVRSLASSPGGEHLYAASLTDDAVVVFDRDNDPTSDNYGRLFFVEAHSNGDAGVAGIDGATDVTLSPDGAYVYVAGLNSGAVATFRRDWKTGRLEFTSVAVDDTDGVDGLAGAAGLVVAPDNGGLYNLYAAGSADDSVAVFLRTAEGTCSSSQGVGDVLTATLDLEAGSTVTLTAIGLIHPAARGTLENIASVAVPVGVVDPVPGNNDGTDQTNLTVVSDLVVTKDDGQDNVTAGSRIAYTIVVANDGPSYAGLVTAVDILPPELLAVNVTCAASPGSSCVSGVLGNPFNVWAGGAVTYTVSGRVNPGAIGTLVNQVDVTVGQGTDPDLLNNTAIDSDVIVAAADLSISKSDDLDPASANDVVTYTISVVNPGPSHARDVVVTETLPAGVTFQATTGCLEDPLGVPTCSFGTVTAGSVASYMVAVTVDPTTTGIITNRAVVLTSVSDPNLVDNVVTEDTEVAWVTLAVSKVDAVDPVAAGTDLDYTVTVSNGGPYDASGVVINENLPLGVTAVSTSGCAEDAGGGIGIPVCTVGGVPSGGSVPITVRVNVDSSSLGAILNSVTVTGAQYDPDLLDNAATEATQVVAEADLGITKDNGLSVMWPGLDTQYQITISNPGPSDAQAAEVQDDMPVELINVSWTCIASGGAFCQPSGFGNFLLDTVSIPAGDSVTYSVDGTVDPALPATGTVSNTASVTAMGALTDPNSTNNQATDSDALDATIFVDGFETGDSSPWSQTVRREP